jgi:hypothetical protein
MVTGSSGLYGDYATWNAVAFHSREEAEIHQQKAQEWADAVEDTFDAHEAAQGMSPFDPQVDFISNRIQYDVVSFSVGTLITRCADCACKGTYRADCLLNYPGDDKEARGVGCGVFDDDADVMARYLYDEGEFDIETAAPSWCPKR